VTRETYWQPERGVTGGSDVTALAEEFAGALQNAGRRRVEGLGKNGLLLSGGADSRGLLYAAEHPERVESITFCDRDNAEVETARAIAAAAHSPHHVLRRGAEHYGLGAWETVRVTGGMWSIKDAHYHGFAGQLRALAPGNLMTGCYTDYLFKGLGYNKVTRRILGRRSSLDALAPFAAEYYQPYSRIASFWTGKVSERIAQWMSSDDIAAYERDPFVVEDRRIRPLAREADAMGRLYLLRTQAWDPVMVENELISLYGRIPAELKINARVFRKAVTQVAPPTARHIPNNNDYSPLHTPEWLRAIRYLWRNAIARIERKLSGRQPDTALSTDGSWPNFTYYVMHSPVIAELWSAPSPAQRELFADLLGEDAWGRPLVEWARRDVDLMLRLLTLKIWLNQRGV
jgi:asparagine synthase (glutamine-hydrolysing)